MIERQKLRLILAYTKILYSDTDEEEEEEEDDDADDDSAFDYLFRFIQAVMNNYDDLTILGTKYTIEDFNNFMTFDDFLAFENFKNKLLGVNEVIEERVIHNNKLDQSDSESISSIQRTPKTPSSPLKASARYSTDLLDDDTTIDKVEDYEDDKPNPPTPPLPRKSKLLSINDPPMLISTFDSPTSPTPICTPPTEPFPVHELENDISIPVSKSELALLVSDVEDLNLNASGSRGGNGNGNEIEVQEPQFKTPLRPNKPIELQSTPVSLLTPTKNSLVKPSEQISTKFIKYTEKDRILAEQAERERLIAEEKAKNHKEVEKSAVRGERKVSRLARLYEEKLLGK